MNNNCFTPLYFHKLEPRNQPFLLFGNFKTRNWKHDIESKVQATDRQNNFFLWPTDPTILLRVGWQLINIFLSQALAFWRPDVVSKNLILIRILRSLGYHQVISWQVDIKISHLTFTSSFNLNEKANQILIKSLYPIYYWLIAVFYGK